MQVTSLFAIFFAFLGLVVPLAPAFIITAPSSLATGNTSVSATIEQSDPSGTLTLVIVRDAMQAVIATELVNASHAPEPVQVPVIIPAVFSGDGWKIQALTSEKTVLAESSPFSIRGTLSAASIGAIAAGAVLLAVLGFLCFVYLRRRAHQRQIPAFDLEHAFTHAKAERSGSSLSRESNVLASETLAGETKMWSAADKAGSEADKVQWERELEEQFARARAATPQPSGGSAPVSRNTPPPPPMELGGRGVSALSRNTSRVGRASGHPSSPGVASESITIKFSAPGDVVGSPAAG